MYSHVCMHIGICYIQVNEKFYKLERVYRDCIKMTRDKTRIYSILYQALDDSDQTRKYGISDP